MAEVRELVFVNGGTGWKRLNSLPGWATEGQDVESLHDLTDQDYYAGYNRLASHGLSRLADGYRVVWQVSGNEARMWEHAGPD
jgi:hypothetical protein